MLGTVIITIKANNTCMLPALPGRFLHAVMFFLISVIDEHLSVYWHSKSGVKPFSISLISEKGTNEINEIRKGDTLFLRINLWHSELWLKFQELQSLLQDFRLEIGPLRARVVGVYYEAPFELILHEDNLLDLVQWRLESDSVRQIEFQFITPALFNGTHGAITFPTASLIFASIVDKWNAGDIHDQLDKNRVKKICERIVLTEWKGQTKRVYFGRDRGYTGFVGTFSFDVSRLTLEENQLITILALFGQHSGIGRLSSQSLGQVRVTLQNK
jgi:putative CRISPR-associated endoribonuclease cas6